MCYLYDGGVLLESLLSTDPQSGWAMLLYLEWENIPLSSFKVTLLPLTIALLLCHKPLQSL